MTIWQRWKQTSLHNKALVFSGVIVAFGTLFYSGAAIVQVCMFNRSSKQAEEQTAKLIEAANTQACAASKNAEAAARFASSAEGINAQTQNAVKQFKRLADDTETNIRNAQKTFRDEQRAWVGIGITRPQVTSFESTNPIEIDIPFFNSGKTPARNVREVVNAILSPMPMSQPTPSQIKQLEDGPFGSLPSIPPQGTQTLIGGKPPAIGEITSRQQRLDRDAMMKEFDKIKSGKWVYYLIGEIRYDDVAGRPHITQFCVFISDTTTKNVASCFGFNEIE